MSSINCVLLNNSFQQIHNSLTNKYAVITGTTPSYNTETSKIAYPNGFNADNCVIISSMYKISGSGWGWYDSQYSNNYVVMGKLRQDGIYVENLFNNSSFVGVPFKLVIMRTDI